jgi:hypothetical protein
VEIDFPPLFCRDGVPLLSVFESKPAVGQGLFEVDPVDDRLLALGEKQIRHVFLHNERVHSLHKTKEVDLEPNLRKYRSLGEALA